MAMTGAERQAKHEGKKRKELADALAKIKELEARVAILQEERDRLDGLVGFALKQEEWAERRVAEETEREAEAADDETAPAASKVVVIRAPSPRGAPSALGSTHVLAHARTASSIPPWLVTASC